MATNRMRWGGLVLSALALATPARAELLYFKDGGRLHVAAEVLDGQVRVKGATEDYLFPTEDFLEIVPGHDPEREWKARRETALASGPEVRFAAACWAIENGLIPEAVAMLRATHAADRAHQPTARLVALLDRLDPPSPDPDPFSLLKSIGVPLDRTSSRHIVLYHETTREQAEARLDMLERVLTAFYLVLTADGFELEPPDEKLVFVALRDQSDYLAFLRSQRAGAFSTTYGYYHPAYRAVITFDLRTAPRWASAYQSLERMRSRVPFALTSPTALSDPRMRNLQRRRLLQEMEIRANADGTAAHELVHALTRASGLAPTPEVFPHWLHEGLAAQFEVVRGGRWAGVGQPHDLRLSDWRKVEPAPNLDGLIRDRGFGHGYQSGLYARSWALVQFLRSAHSSQFLKFLQLLRSPPDKPGSPRFATCFLSVFGSDLDEFETDWTRFFEDIHTPLEDFAPKNSSGSPDARD